MKAVLHTLLAGFFTLLILSSMVSIMAIFMGGGAHPALAPLLQLQAWSLLPVVGIIILIVIVLLKLRGSDHFFPTLWRATPGWIIFGFFLVNSVVLLGELAIIIIMMMTEGSQHSLPDEHIPLLASLLASVGFWLNYHVGSVIKPVLHRHQ